jgi:hypothetical protein
MQAFGVTNFTTVVGILMMIGAGFTVVSSYIVPILSPKIIELVAYILSLCLLNIHRLIELNENSMFYLSLPGQLLLPLVTYYSIKSRNLTFTKNYEKWFLLCLSVFWLLQTVLWNSKLLGVFAMSAFYSCIGFIVLGGPGFVAFGFDSDDPIQTFSTISRLILVIYMFVCINEYHTLSLVKLLNPAITIYGTFTFCITCLIMSTRSYGKYKFDNILLNNLQTIISFCIMYYFGNKYQQLAYMRNVVGTFAMLYLMEKWCDLPWKGFWPIMALVSGFLIWQFGIIATQYPILLWNDMSS